MTNSRTKGKRAELEIANHLTESGFKSRRGQQFKGTKDSPDVISELPYHIEVKRRQSFNLHKAMTKAASESDKPPVIFHRKDREEWIVSMRMDDWIELHQKMKYLEIALEEVTEELANA